MTDLSELLERVKVGDTVRILRARNAYGADVYAFSEKVLQIGDTYVVGEIQDDAVFPCKIVFPVGEAGDFWREDDLELQAFGETP